MIYPLSPISTVTVLRDPFCPVMVRVTLFPLKTGGVTMGGFFFSSSFFRLRLAAITIAVIISAAAAMAITTNHTVGSPSISVFPSVISSAYSVCSSGFFSIDTS